MQFADTAKHSDNKTMAFQNTHPTGIDKEKLKERTEKLATKLFPKEKWNEVSKNVFLADGREPINKNERVKLDKETKMAEIASRFGHVTYLLPEKSSGKNCDSVMDGVLTEFKEVTGNEHKIQKRFSESLKQGSNSFLKIDMDIEPERVHQLLHGRMANYSDLQGFVYIFLTKKNQMYKWSFDSLK